MKKFLLSLVFVFFTLGLCQAQSDSLSRYAALDSLLTQFYTALLFEDTASKNAEMDALISTCHDKQMQEYIGRQIFEHYRSSKVMGEEAVAIHIYDKWFADGTLTFMGEFTALEAEIFVKFNRNSLIGMIAPKVTLFNPCGARVQIPRKNRLSILFFYDTMCKKCMMESELLPQILKDTKLNLDFVAIYAGDDRKEWNKFRRSFRLPYKSVRLLHLWDPKMESEYQFYYGVTGTPRLFVVLDNGEIIGRRLEPDNLQQVLSYLEIVN